MRIDRTEIIRKLTAFIIMHKNEYIALNCGLPKAAPTKKLTAKG